MNKVKDDAIITERIESIRPFVWGGSTGLNGATILDYWQWAYSGIIGNTERGNLAEFLVSRALGVTDDVRNDWEDFDLTTEDGIKIEVKSSAYVQAWKQKKPSTPSFGIGKTLSTWDYSSETRQRYADIYVFCLLAHLDKETINPMDIGQWEFYALRTDEIEKEFGNAKSISLKSVRNRSK